ncbi:riboflavin kinase [Halobacillus rhizosphaerae]|uniref:riboflavin kinase n=1 Tax=Halobacillus rhizosphaerae TaxID=3064889 RepID=UPI00398B00FF
MDTIEVTSAIPQSSDPVVLVIGKWDGFHKGHQQLVDKAKQLASYEERVSVLGFAGHSRPGCALSSYEDRIHAFKSAGADRYYHMNSSENQTIEEVIENSIRSLNIKRMIISEDFHWDETDMKHSEAVEEAGRKNDVPVTVLPSATIHGLTIQSSTIRTLISKGHMEAAQSMLGRPFEITGIVEKGEQLGRQLGFPTLNMGDIQDYVELRPGVYLGIVDLSDDSSYYTLVSAGYRPTVNGDSYKVEAYLLDFSGDLYGRQVTLKFFRHLRDEVNFEGLDALVEQMKMDELEARKILGITDTLEKEKSNMG